MNEFGLADFCNRNTSSSELFNVFIRKHVNTIDHTHYVVGIHSNTS